MSYILIIIILVLGSAIGLIASYVLNVRKQRNADESIDLISVQKMALDISGNHVMRLDLKGNNVYDVHGKAFFGNNVTIEYCYTFIHPDDQPVFRSLIERLSQGLVKEDSCTYRWDYNYTGQGNPDWRNMRIQAIAEYDGDDTLPSGIIATLTDETDIIHKQEEQQEWSERYKTIFENSIVGLSFYTPEGMLLDANAIMRKICNFDSDESDAFFSQANLFDLAPFSEVLDPNNIEEFWFCTLSIVPERDMYIYLEIHLHPIKDEQGRLVYIALTVRDVSGERQMYLQAKQNDLDIQQANARIQVLETELNYMMEGCDLQAWRISLAQNRIDFYRGLNTVDNSFTLQQMLGIFVNQEDEFVRKLANPEEFLAEPKSHICQMYPVVLRRNVEPQWIQINCIPEYDENGKLKGAFGVWRNITKLMQKQEALRRETERANDSGRMKSVFLANMTHEIRTPLNAIVGFTDLLQVVEAPEEKREMIRIIHNNCDMLLRLVDDILVLSKMDANNMVISPEELDFASEFDVICQPLEQRVSESSVQFVKENPCQSLVISIDKVRIQQVITNFVTNSIKNTREGHIRVGYRMEERDGKQGLYVYCEDTGVGIPQDQLKRIFERFVKLNDYIQGTGLGLPICRAIIEKCGGEVGVDSVVDKGSTFWFWIPVEVVKK